MIEGEKMSEECLAFVRSIGTKNMISVKQILSDTDGASIVETLVTRGVISPIGNGGHRFAVNQEILTATLSENGGDAEKTRLANKPIKQAKTKRTIEDIMSEIEEIPDLPCLKGDERLNAISKAVTRLHDEISRFNQALTVLDGKSRIKFSSSPATIEEVIPEGDGLGGIKISYRNQTLVGVWEDGIDQVWLDQKVEKVSDWLADRLANNVRIAQKQKH